MAAVALGSKLFLMGEKPERYVIHIRDSKSSRNAQGQSPYCRGSAPLGDSLRSPSSVLVRIQLSSSVAGVGRAAGGEERLVVESESAVVEGVADGVVVVEVEEDSRRVVVRRRGS